MIQWTNIAHKTCFLIMGPLAVWLTKKAKGWGPNKRDLDQMPDLDKFSHTFMIGAAPT